MSEPVVAWTNYPLRKDVDPKGTVYRVEVLAYDENKYVIVKESGEYFSIKSGYLCTDAACVDTLSKPEFDRVPASLELYLELADLTKS